MIPWQTIGVVSCFVAIGCGFVALQELRLHASVRYEKVGSTLSRPIPLGVATRGPSTQLRVQYLPTLNPKAQIYTERLEPQTAALPNGKLVAAAATAAAVVAYAVTSMLQVARRRSIALAAYQSEFAPGARVSVRLHGAAEDAALKKDLGLLQKGAEDKMDKALEALAGKFATVRTGRANPAMLDRIRVEYYGALTPLKQVAGISIPDATTIIISPFDKASIVAIEKAISNSDMGLTPGNDGNVVRIKVPPLTEDRRKDMVKQVAKMGEESRVQVRNVRRDTLKAAEKLKLSENAEADFKDDIQKATDRFIKKVDDLVKAKEKDLTTV